MGCGGDPREQQINLVLQIMDETASHLDQIQANLKKVVDKGGFKKEDLKDAETAADKLKDETGKQLLEVQRRILQATDKKPLTDEEKKELERKFSKRVEEKLGDLKDKFDKVNKYLAEAEKIEPQIVQRLKIKLKDAQSDYEAIAKR
jgi:hypothetical protein